MDAKSMLKTVALRGLMGALLIGLTPWAQAAPEIQHWTTDNGARVFFVPAPDLPMVDVRVVFDAGSARGADQPGIAALTNAMLAEGAGGQDGNALAVRFESLGARLSNGALKDMGWMHLRSLSAARYLDPAAKTLATILSQPDFPGEDFTRERERMLVGLQAREQSPGTIASDAFYRALYGDHPYARPSSGEPGSVKALTPGDLRRFHGRYYVAANAVVAIVGALDRERAQALAHTLTQGLPKGQAAEALPEVPPLTEAKTLRIDHPSSQSHILMGQPGVRRGDADYYALYLANHSLGGSGLVARLSDSIREQRGLAYSVYSYFLPMGRRGPFEMGMQTRNDQVDEALELMRAELKTYLEQGPTQEEFEASKQNVMGGFPLRIDGNGKIVEYLAMIGFYRLPLDYLNTFTAKIGALTREQVHRAMRERLDPDRMVTVIVGGGA